MRIINHNLSITDPSIGTSPMSLAPQPRQPPSWELHRCSSIFFISFFTRKPRLNPFVTVMREPILRQVNYELSPTHIRYCGCTVRLASIASEPNHQFLSKSFHSHQFISSSSSHVIVIMSFHVSKTFNRMSFIIPRFS